MTLAEQIVFDLLKKLGYREPKQSSQWHCLVDIAQQRINARMDAMTRIAAKDAKQPDDSTLPLRVLGFVVCLLRME